MLCCAAVVMEQMSGDRHRSPVYNRLRDYINDEAPIRNGREWLEGLLRHPDNEMRMVGLRIMETQEIYVVRSSSASPPLPQTPPRSVSGQPCGVARKWPG